MEGPILRVTPYQPLAISILPYSGRKRGKSIRPFLCEGARWPGARDGGKVPLTDDVY